ncbi:MAG: NAD(P)H-dependent oxidoreductase [Oscillospiraceae bacterium]|jgi:flavodoxin|nr:NAD(P)H-dependent oxidoreductase [Oscillospiraceae bacterium]
MVMKTLVAYFSASGVTKAVAEALASAAQADLFEIRPETPYTQADLDWRNKQSRSSVEMADPTSRPKMQGMIDIAPYEVVFVGFPIWWYTAPHVVLSFLESADFSGKTVVPFATSGSSGLGNTEVDMQAVTAGEVKWGQGKMLNGQPDAQALRDWVRSVLKG